MSKKFLFLILGIILASSYGNLSRAAWLDPSQPPPQGNVAAPINVGPVVQTKSGALIVNYALAPTGFVVMGAPADAQSPTGYGSVGIGTLLPAAKLDVVGSGNTASTYAFGVRNSDKLYAIAVRDDLSVGIGLVQPTLRLQVSGSGPDGIAFFGPSATGRGVWIDSAGNLGIGVHKFPGTLPFGLVLTELGTNKDAQIRLQSDYAVNGPLNQIWFRKVDPKTGVGPDWILEQRFKNNAGDNIFVVKAADAPGGGEDLLTLTQGTNSGTAKVGIGTINPSSKLTVVGTIESASGGFKFPDGTVQITAAQTTPPANVSAGENLRIVRGSVTFNQNGGGNQSTIQAGTGFTIKYNQATNYYTVKFTQPFSGLPSVVMSSYNDNCKVMFGAPAPVQTTDFGVYCTYSIPTPTDFIAIGTP